MSTPRRSPAQTRPANAPPPPVPLLDTAKARLTLAGLGRPEQPQSATVDKEIDDVILRFACVLAHLYGDELDRLKLWVGITKAIQVAAGRATNDADLDDFVSSCLDEIQADAGRTAACEELGQLLETFRVRPPEWRRKLLATVSRHSLILVNRARLRWSQVKSKEVDL